MKKLLNLCFIDDDVIFQFMVKRIVTCHNLANKMWLFNDGEVALKYLLEQQQNPLEIPDIIFLDINMPIMDGWQFLAEFKKFKASMAKPVTIYMVSSSNDSRDLGQAKEIEEISGYLVKPLKLEHLEQVINDFLEPQVNRNC